MTRVVLRWYSANCGRSEADETPDRVGRRRIAQRLLNQVLDEHPCISRCVCELDRFVEQRDELVVDRKCTEHRAAVSCDGLLRHRSGSELDEHLDGRVPGARRPDVVSDQTVYGRCGPRPG